MKSEKDSSDFLFIPVLFSDQRLVDLSRWILHNFNIWFHIYHFYYRFDKNSIVEAHHLCSVK